MMTELPRLPVAAYGVLRSGTTVLRLMLDAHSGLSCPGETDFFFDHLRDEDSYDEEALERDRIYRAHRERYADQPLPELTPDALIGRISGADWTVVLMPNRHISNAVALYPDLRIIHFLPDPRDVPRSSIGMGWAGNVYHGVDHWMDTERDWARVAPRLKPGQYFTIYYESLIDAPEEMLSRICQFIGVDYEPVMLDYDKISIYSKPSPELTFQWQRKQSPREVGLVETKIGPMLAAAGYAPSGFALHRWSAFGKFSLTLEKQTRDLVQTHPTWRAARSTGGKGGAPTAPA